MAALEVVPVSGIGGEDAKKEYLPLFTKCIGDLQKIVDREKRNKEAQIAEDKEKNYILDQWIKRIKKRTKKRINELKETEPKGDKRESGDEFEGRD